MSEIYRIAYDVEHRRVGCVLIQAALGGTVPRALFHDLFGDVDGWTVNANDCQVYPADEATLRRLAEITIAKIAKAATK